MTTLNKWRIYCNTETTWITKWETSDITPDVLCFNDSGHSVNINSLSITDTVAPTDTNIRNLSLTSFDELRVAERTRIFEIKSIFGKSEFRDIYTTEDGGTITNDIGDATYALAVSNTNGRALLQSAERGRYVAGLQAETGIAAILPQQTLAGNQFCKIGLYDDANGMYFKYTSAGLAVAILRDSVENVIERTSWNIDKLDGTGPSKHVLNFADGMIFKILFTWYGFGSINFYINITNSTTNVQSGHLIHTYKPGSTTSVKNPNLPIRVELDNNGTSGALSMQVAGRQYSLLGKYDPIIRIASHYTTSTSISSIANFIPIISIRRKTGYLGTPIKILSFDIISSSNIFIQVRTMTSLTGAVFGNISDTASADTAMEADTTATVVTGGKPIYTALTTGDNKSSNISTVDINYNLTEYSIITLCAKGVSAINGSVTAVLRWTEEW